MRSELCPHYAIEYPNPEIGSRKIRALDLCILEHVVGCGETGMLLHGIAKTIAEKTWKYRRLHKLFQGFPHRWEAEHQKHTRQVMSLLEGRDVLGG